MRPTKFVNIPIAQNEDFDLTIYIPSGGLPTDLTDCTFTGVLKTATNVATPIASFAFTIENQITKKGKVRWKMAALVTIGIPASTAYAENECPLQTPYLYDVFMVDAGGLRSRILAGKVFVSAKVT